MSNSAQDLAALEMEERRTPGKKRYASFGDAVYPMSGMLATARWRGRFMEATPAVRRKMIEGFEHEHRLRNKLGLRTIDATRRPSPRPREAPP